MTIYHQVMVSFIAALFLGYRLVFYLHMFQLNAYRPDRFWRWWRQNRRKAMPTMDKLVLVILLIFSLAACHHQLAVWLKWFLPILWGILLILAILTNQIFKERLKKPLVYTARVWRLLITSCLVVIFVGGLGTWLLFNVVSLPVAFFYLWLIVLISLTVVWLMVGYYLLQPFEKMMVRRYYRQAKAILTGNRSLIKIGITGSYGKTGTKFILERLLSTTYSTLVTPHSYNTPLGVIRTVREKLKANHQIFVAEMGAKQVGDIKELTDLVEPTIGIITAVGPQHLETFGTQEDVLRTKFELALATSGKGITFVNSDNALIRQGMDTYPEINYKTYGTNEQADFRILDIQMGAFGSKFTVSHQGDSQQYQTDLLGRHAILNMTAGIAVATHLGIETTAIKLAVRDIRPVPHRLELKRQNGYYLLDDAFNANPTGAGYALEVLNQFEGGKKIVITPGMIELGELEEESHRLFGQQIAAVADVVILVGPKKTKSIRVGLQASQYPADQIKVVGNIFEAFEVLTTVVTDGDTVLIENDLPDNYNE